MLRHIRAAAAAFIASVPQSLSRLALMAGIAIVIVFIAGRLVRRDSADDLASYAKGAGAYYRENLRDPFIALRTAEVTGLCIGTFFRDKREDFLKDWTPQQICEDRARGVFHRLFEPLDEDFIACAGGANAWPVSADCIARARNELAHADLAGIYRELHLGGPRVSRVSRGERERAEDSQKNDADYEQSQKESAELDALPDDAYLAQHKGRQLSIASIEQSEEPLTPEQKVEAWYKQRMWDANLVCHHHRQQLEELVVCRNHDEWQKHPDKDKPFARLEEGNRLCLDFVNGQQTGTFLTDYGYYNVALGPLPVTLGEIKARLKACLDGAATQEARLACTSGLIEEIKAMKIDLDLLWNGTAGVCNYDGKPNAQDLSRERADCLAQNTAAQRKCVRGQASTPPSSSRCLEWRMVWLRNNCTYDSVSHTYTNCQQGERYVPDHVLVARWLSDNKCTFASAEAEHASCPGIPDSSLPELVRQCPL